MLCATLNVLAWAWAWIWVCACVAWDVQVTDEGLSHLLPLTQLTDLNLDSGEASIMASELHMLVVYTEQQRYDYA